MALTLNEDFFEMVVPLSDDPISGLKRKGFAKDFVAHFYKKSVILVVEVRYYESDDAVEDGYGVEIDNPRFKPYNVRLVADNTTKVDEMGNIIPKYIEVEVGSPSGSPSSGSPETETVLNPDWENGQGEFDFWAQTANNPMNIFDLMQQTMTVADSLRARYN